MTAGEVRDYFVHYAEFHQLAPERAVVESILQESPDRELPTTLIGEHLMNKLRSLDKIAYVRFASVYRDFQDLEEFLRELKT